jgi:CspA family cold shock protein
MITGTVQWFDPNRGVGFIRSDDGLEIFVDIVNVRISNLEILLKGQRLEFDVHVDQENNKAAAARNIKLCNLSAKTQ